MDQACHGVDPSPSGRKLKAGRAESERTRIVRRTSSIQAGQFTPSELAFYFLVFNFFFSFPGHYQVDYLFYFSFIFLISFFFFLGGCGVCYLEVEMFIYDILPNRIMIKRKKKISI